MSNLQFTINNANLKKSSDIGGSMQNYIYLKYSGNGSAKEYRSSIVQGGIDKPIVWNETINIQIPQGSHQDARLDVEIRDEDMTSDDTCAKGFINLEHCGFFTPGKKNYCIRMHDLTGVQIAGDLTFSTNLN